MTFDPEAHMERISAITPDIVRIYTMDRAFSWVTWLCPACRDLWKRNGWTEKGAKEPPHPLTCDECGRDDAQQQPAKAA